MQQTTIWRLHSAEEPDFWIAPAACDIVRGDGADGELQRGETVTLSKNLQTDLAEAPSRMSAMTWARVLAGTWTVDGPY